MFSFNRWSIFRDKIAISQIEVKKKAYLNDAQAEAISAHPEIGPRSLICPISLTLMQEPVITEQGHVYDKVNILKSLKLDSLDPLTRKRLSEDQLYPFPELLSGPIGTFATRQINYLKHKEELLESARVIAHGEQMNESPSLFTCPISQTIMAVPVITRHGKLYDKKSLENFLRKNHNIDETGLPIGPKDYQLFPEFHQQLRVYLLYRNKMTHQEITQFTEQDHQLGVDYCSLL